MELDVDMRNLDGCGVAPGRIGRKGRRKRNLWGLQLNRGMCTAS